MIPRTSIEDHARQMLFDMQPVQCEFRETSVAARDFDHRDRSAFLERVLQMTVTRLLQSVLEFEHLQPAAIGNLLQLSRQFCVEPMQAASDLLGIRS